MDDQNTKPTQPAKETPPVLPREDTGAQPVEPSTPPVVVASKPRRKGLIIGIVIAAIALLLGGGAAAYFFWYQNPEKVITDGIMHAISSKDSTFKGNFASGEQIKVEIDGRSHETSVAISGKATFKQNNQDKTLSGEITLDNMEAYYAKVDGVGKLFDAYRSALSGNPEVQAQLDAIIAKVNNKWIKLSDTASEGEVRERRCVSDTVKKMQNDGSMASEVVNLYKKHKVIKIDKELGTKDGSFGYSLKLDSAAASDLTKSFKETKAYKDVKACAPDFEISESDVSPAQSKDDDKMHTEIWISQWGHQITKINLHDMSSPSGFKATIEPVFGGSVEEIKAPQEFTTTEELNAEIEALQGVLLAPMATGR